MINPLMWLRSKINNAMFHRAYRRAPVVKLGNLYVKEVWHRFYVVSIEGTR